MYKRGVGQVDHHGQLNQASKRELMSSWADGWNQASPLSSDSERSGSVTSTNEHFYS